MMPSDDEDEELDFDQKELYEELKSMEQTQEALDEQNVEYGDETRAGLKELFGENTSQQAAFEGEEETELGEVPPAMDLSKEEWEWITENRLMVTSCGH
jgi:hypothetical protein